jgi:hypothetical protein
VALRARSSAKAGPRHAPWTGAYLLPFVRSFIEASGGVR